MQPNRRIRGSSVESRRLGVIYFWRYQPTRLMLGVRHWRGERNSCKRLTQSQCSAANSCSRAGSRPRLIAVAMPGNLVEHPARTGSACEMGIHIRAKQISNYQGSPPPGRPRKSDPRPRCPRHQHCDELDVIGQRSQQKNSASSLMW